MKIGTYWHLMKTRQNVTVVPRIRATAHLYRYSEKQPSLCSPIPAYRYFHIAVTEFESQLLTCKPKIIQSVIARTQNGCQGTNTDQTKEGELFYPTVKNTDISVGSSFSATTPHTHFRQTCRSSLITAPDSKRLSGCRALD